MLKHIFTIRPVTVTLALALSVALSGPGCSTSSRETSAAAVFPDAAFDPANTEYAQILANVVKGKLVDYASLKESQTELEKVVADFGGLENDSLAAMTDDQQIAFYINAYNAITLLSIVEKYPLKSIKDISGVWNKRKWSVAGQKLTLDDIEHTRLRKNFTEPRIHFAVNCASIGCPPLAPVPYRGETLSEQLDKSCREYFSDTTLTRLDINSNKLHTSKIFDWFGDDFESFKVNPDANKSLSRKEAAIVSFIASFLSDEKAPVLLAETRSLKYLSYDWGLNDIKR